MKVQVAIFALLFVTYVLADGCTVGRNSPRYNQCDDRWGSLVMETKTICRVGCLMSSVASALASLGKTINGKTVDPGNLHQFLKWYNGYQGNLFVWGSVKGFGLKYEGQPSSGSEIRAAICAKKVVILNVNNGGHWVLATGYSGSSYQVVDSGYSRTSYGFGEVEVAGVFGL